MESHKANRMKRCCENLRNINPNSPIRCFLIALVLKQDSHSLLRLNLFCAGFSVWLMCSGTWSGQQRVRICVIMSRGITVSVVRAICTFSNVSSKPPSEENECLLHIEHIIWVIVPRCNSKSKVSQLQKYLPLLQRIGANGCGAYWRNSDFFFFWWGLILL